MSISVSVKNGRITVLDNGRIVREGRRDIIQAVTDGGKIFVLVENGRVQELDKSLQFKWDISVNYRATSIKFSEGSLFVTDVSGRATRFVNGKMVWNGPADRAHEQLSAKHSNKSLRPSAAEQLGETLANKALAVGEELVRQAISAYAEKKSKAGGSQLLAQNDSFSKIGSGGAVSNSSDKTPSDRDISLLRRIDKEIGLGKFLSQICRLFRLEKLWAIVFKRPNRSQ